MSDGLTLEQLARRQRTAPGRLAELLADEVRRGRVEVVRPGVYRLSSDGRRQLEPILGGIDGFAAIREPR